MLYLLRRKLKKSQMGLFDWHNPTPHHIAYNRTTASGKVVHVAAKGQQAVREKLEHGMEIMYRAPDMKKRRKGTVTGGDESGWHITGQRQGYELTPEKRILSREHIWTLSEHAASKEKKGTFEATSSQGRQLKATVVNERAASGSARLGIPEAEVLAHPDVIRNMRLQLGQLARQNHIPSPYTMQGGMLTNEDPAAMDMYSEYMTAMIGSLRRQTANASDELVDEFRDHLQNTRDNSRVMATMLRDGKTAAIRYVADQAEHHHTHDEYDTAGEDNYESGMRDIAERSSTRYGQTASDKAGLMFGVSQQLHSLEDPIAASIIKMRFGLGKHGGTHTPKEIADALNDTHGTTEWTSDRVNARMKDALVRLGKTKGMKELLGFLKSMRVLEDLRKSLAGMPAQVEAYSPPPPRQPIIPNIEIPLEAMTTSGETIEVRMPAREALSSVMNTIKTLTRMKEALHAGA